VFGAAEGQRHDGEHGIEAAVGDMQGGVDDEQIVVGMNAAHLSVTEVARVVAHAAGSRLMLSGAQAEAGWGSPYTHCPARFHPFPCSLVHEGRGLDCFGVRCAGEFGYRDSISVADVGSDLDAALRVGDVLDRPHDVQGAVEVLPHPALVRRPPARHVEGIEPRQKIIGSLVNSFASMPPPTTPALP